MKNKDFLCGKISALRDARPLVLNITNYVAMNFSANILLAAGVSPIMSSFPEEIEDIMSRCDGLLVNIGCLDTMVEESARKAASIACRRGIKWVLDPVGVGASARRARFCMEMIGKYKPAVIRANASEVECLAYLFGNGGNRVSGRGADTTISGEDVLDTAKRLATTSGAVVSMSGKTDFITDGNTIVRIDGGSPVMSEITAMGCSASALTAAFASLGGDMVDAASIAMQMMASAGEAAASVTRAPGSFQIRFIDAVSSLGRRRFNKDALRLYLVTDRGIAGGKDIAEIAKDAVLGGVTMVQLREKDSSTDEFVKLAIKLKNILSPLGVPLIINDRIDVALAADADGVHIGQSDMPYHQARRLMGPDKIIGLSVERIEQVREANELDVDYIGISPVFSTTTKTDTATPFGLDGLRKAAALSAHPTVAIGGINKENAGSIIDGGADGIAIVSAIMSAPSPRKAAEQLIEAMK